MIKKLSYFGVALLWIALLWLLPLGQAKAAPSIVGKTTESIRSQTRFQEILGPLPSEKVDTGVDKKSNDKYPRVEDSEPHFGSNNLSKIEDSYFTGNRLGRKIGKFTREKSSAFYDKLNSR